jgi:hypothetical protein
MVAGQVADAGGNTVAPGALGTFTVRTDDVAPSAAYAAPAAVTSEATTAQSFKVTYADNRAVNAGTIGAGDVRVTGPNGFDQLAAFVGVDATTPGTPRVATYSVAAPAGKFTTADNGTWTVLLRGGQVADTSGNFAAAGTLGTFTVAVVPPPDTAAPTAQAAAPSLTSASSTAQLVRVTYADDRAVQTATLDSADVRLAGPDGASHAATFVGVDVNTPGTPRVATYSVAAPGGAWDAADNGAWTVQLQAAQVADTSGNFAAAGAVGSFTVAVNTNSPPATDTVSPQLVSGRWIEGTTFDRLTFRFSENIGTSMDPGDLVVKNRATGEVLPASAMTVTFDPSTLYATVAFPGYPGGRVPVGQYLVTVKGAGITDLAGNVMDGDRNGTPGGDYRFYFDKVAPATAILSSTTTSSTTAAATSLVA